MNEQDIKPSNGHKAEIWTRVIGAIGGGLLLAMQGVNISETTSQTHLIERIDIALKQQSELVKEVNHEGARIDKAMENQRAMIESMDTLLGTQNATLELLKKAQDRKPENPSNG